MNVGDRVRLLHYATDDENSYPIGQTGTITYISRNYYYVTFDQFDPRDPSGILRYHTRWPCEESELERIDTDVS